MFLSLYDTTYLLYEYVFIASLVAGTLWVGARPATGHRRRGSLRAILPIQSIILHGTTTTTTTVLYKYSYYM